MPQLIDDIDAFLTLTGKSPTAFGDEALGDRHFVRQLRAGRRTWPETEQKVRDFMSTNAVALCSRCDVRSEDPHVATCTSAECPMRERVAA